MARSGYSPLVALLFSAGVQAQPNQQTAAVFAPLGCARLDTASSGLWDAPKADPNQRTTGSMFSYRFEVPHW
jgi:hypothetical protein